jgi:uncharacterized membrane protein
MLGVFIWIAPKSQAAISLTAIANAPLVTVATIQPIVQARCIACHAEKPTMLPSAPAGVMLDTPERIHAQAQRVYDQVVKLKAMPLGNVTGITDDERAKIEVWFNAGAKL